MHGHTMLNLADILYSYSAVIRLLASPGTEYSIKPCDPSVLRDHEQRTVVLHAYEYEINARGDWRHQSNRWSTSLCALHLSRRHSNSEKKIAELAEST
jgi:hypothetical protein